VSSRQETDWAYCASPGVGTRPTIIRIQYDSNKYQSCKHSQAQAGFASKAPAFKCAKNAEDETARQ